MVYDKDEKIKYDDSLIESVSESVREGAARMLNYLLRDMFNQNPTEKEHEITKAHFDNSRVVLDRYLANDYQLIKSKISSSREMVKQNELLIYKHINTTDFQIDLIKSCKSHRDWIRKSLILKASDKILERREFNQDLYYDILEYMEDEISKEQEKYENGWWNE